MLQISFTAKCMRNVYCDDIEKKLNVIAWVIHFFHVRRLKES